MAVSGSISVSNSGSGGVSHSTTASGRSQTDAATSLASASASASCVVGVAPVDVEAGAGGVGVGLVGPRTGRTLRGRAGEARVEDVGDRGFRRGVDRFDRLAREEGFVARCVVGVDGLRCFGDPVVVHAHVERTRVGVGRCRRGHFLEPLPVRACRDVGGFPDIGVVDGLRRGLARRRVAPVVVRFERRLGRVHGRERIAAAQRIPWRDAGLAAHLDVDRRSVGRSRQIRARVLWHLDQDGFAVGLVEGDGVDVGVVVCLERRPFDERRSGGCVVGHERRRLGVRHASEEVGAGGGAGGERLGVGEPGELLEHVDRLGGAAGLRGRGGGNRRVIGPMDGFVGVDLVGPRGRGRFHNRLRRGRDRAGTPASPRLGRDRWGDDFLAASQLGDDVADRGGNRLRTVRGNERVADFVRGSELGRVGGHPQLRHVDATRTGEDEEVAVGDRALPLLVRVELAPGQPGAARDLGKGQAFAASDLTKVLAELLR